MSETKDKVDKTQQEEACQSKLLHFLESDEIAWRDADHPELGNGSAAFVAELRAEADGVKHGRKIAKDKSAQAHLI